MIGRKISSNLRHVLTLCVAETDVASFDGNGYIRIDLSNNPITASEDRMHFRFRTVRPNGLLVYSRGSQGDILIVQLLKSRLYFTIGLGGGITDTLWGGAALDDGLWHSVRILRDERQVQLLVDRITQSKVLSGGYYKLNLEREVSFTILWRLQT